MKRICVYGAGAIGAHLAARLAAAGAEVSVIARGAHLAAMRARGITLRTAEGDQNFPVQATENAAEIGPVDAVLVGFRFPALATGVEVPGWHLHALADDRRSGGHVLIADLDHGTIEVDPVTEVHCELPPGVEIVAPADDLADRIHAAETQSPDSAPQEPSR